MKVAVIMAAYNAAPYIELALMSLLRQREAAALDIVVVDDASTDGTADVVQAFAARHGHVRLLRIAHGGPAVARNHALEAITGDTDFVTFLDADDLWPIGRLARDLRHFADDPALEALYATTEIFDTPNAQGTGPDPSGRVLKVRGVQLGAGLYRYGLIQRVGRFDLSFEQCEDADFLLRLFEQRPNFRIVDDINLFYRRHDTNITRDRRTVQRDFMRALHKAAKRRKDLPGFTMPAGIFDAKDIPELMQW